MKRQEAKQKGDRSRSRSSFVPEPFASGLLAANIVAQVPPEERAKKEKDFEFTSG